jgi:hypothetical protein
MAASLAYSLAIRLALQTLRKMRRLNARAVKPNQPAEPHGAAAASAVGVRFLEEFSAE